MDEDYCKTIVLTRDFQSMKFMLLIHFPMQEQTLYVSKMY